MEMCPSDLKKKKKLQQVCVAIMLRARTFGRGAVRRGTVRRKKKSLFRLG